MSIFSQLEYFSNLPDIIYGYSLSIILYHYRSRSVSSPQLPYPAELKLPFAQVRTVQPRTTTRPCAEAQTQQEQQQHSGVRTVPFSVLTRQPCPTTFCASTVSGLSKRKWIQEPQPRHVAQVQSTSGGIHFL